MMEMMELILKIVIFLLLCVSSFSIVTYCRDYKILSGFLAKVKGNADAYDKIRKERMVKEIEKRKDSYISGNKISLSSKIYKRISMTGITDILPGFSTILFVVLCMGVSGIVALIGFIKMGPLVALISGLATIVAIWWIVSVVAYYRRVVLESQLVQFTNAVASASQQYSNVIDIFGIIYDQFKDPLGSALERCYVEAKQTSNKKLALKHLADRFDSAQFSFIVNNLQICGDTTGNYRAVARDISETVAIYANSHEKKRALLRNAKINMAAMSLISIGILLSLTAFLGDVSEFIVHTKTGIILLILLALDLLSGMTMKA